MTLFWIAAALMLLLGYLMFVPALLGKTRTAPISRARLNLELHRQRQAELAADAASPESLNSLATESERHLLGDLETVQEPPAPSTRAGRAGLILALAVVPLLAAGGYAWLGRPDLLAQPPAPAVSRAETEKAIESLAERLQQNPNDLEGWILLGRSLQATQQNDRAVQAFGFALKMAPDNLDLQSFYAEALAEANQGSMLGEPLERVQGILQKNPKHKTALWLAGIAETQRGDMAAAVRHWRLLEAQLPAGSPEAGEIAGFIAKAEAEAGQSGTAPAPAQSATSGKRIQVRVELADELKSQAAPEDTVFIFARAAEGPPMPLAVVRKQVKDLPLEVTLDDSLSMVAGMNLSAFERLVIGARVSKSGRPVPSPGDLEGLTDPVTPGPEARYDIRIGRVVPAGRE
jgi:cytochrome c-type biogenesis protein CcmH